MRNDVAPKAAQPAIAITGGTGFVGRHVASRFTSGHARVISRRTGVEIDDVAGLVRLFDGCRSVVHLAGINLERGEQTFARVHVQGTSAVLEAARIARVERVVLLSYLRARPGTGSPYHESKWRAEEMVRASGLDYTILKAGMIYGDGDQFVDRLARMILKVPVFAPVRLRERPIRPLAVDDLVNVIVAATGSRLTNETLEISGGEPLMLSEAARRVAATLGKRIALVPLPLVVHRAMAQVMEWAMDEPFLAKSQARMLAEGMEETAHSGDELPADLLPRLSFDDAQIRRSLPDVFGCEQSSECRV